MKTLLRISALAAALALSAFATTGHAVVNGTCYVSCYNPTTHKSTLTTSPVTLAACCSRTFNPCPAGSNPGIPTYLPPTGGPLTTCWP